MMKSDDYADDAARVLHPAQPREGFPDIRTERFVRVATYSPPAMP
jgi:hypothetical protein